MLRRVSILKKKKKTGGWQGKKADKTINNVDRVGNPDSC